MAEDLFGPTSGRPRVKICGITHLADALAAVELGADALGFVFYPPSPRAVSPATAGRIIDALTSAVTPVGVVVDPDEALVRAVLGSGVRVLQLHGGESPLVVDALASRGIPVIKAVRVAAQAHVTEALALYGNSPLLFDAAAAGLPGGTGRPFDWAWLAACRAAWRNRFVALSGGISADNVAAALALVRPTAFDLSSSVEESPGRKSRARLEAFFAALASACQPDPA